METVFNAQSVGGYNLTIQIDVEDLNISEEEKKLYSKYGSKLFEQIHELKIKNDPETIERKRQWELDVDKAFKDAGFDIVYRKEIPNEYSSSNYYPNSFLVTTKLGAIKLEHRKRVYEIDYSGLDKKTEARVLFDKEDTTKFDYVIHAWGINKLTEYLKILNN